MTFIAFVASWWFMWLFLGLWIGLLWLADRLSEEDDIDALLRWERDNEVP
jgi:hypothetical protein